MIDIHQAIYALDSCIVTIRGDVAYDANEKEVSYDMEQAKAKLAELQAAETQAEQAIKDAKESALIKLAKLGLTEEEIKSLLG